MGEKTFFEIFSDSTHYNEQLFATIQERIEHIKNKGVPIIAEEHSNTWALFDEHFSQNHFIDFNITIFQSDQTNKEELTLFLKSWLILLLENNYSFHFVARKIRLIKKALELSNQFNLFNIDEFEQHYFPESYKNNTLKFRAANLLEFIDFAQNIILPEEYYELILSYYHLKNSELIRILPKTQDVLKFSLVVENYFDNEKNDIDYWEYYPIYLWWTITNIIPIRINEFCNLKNDCLTKEDEGYYLILPRSKQTNNRNKLYDKILISDRVAYLISNYQINITSKRATKTLLQTDNTFQNYRPEIFNQRNFKSLLENFYKHIVCSKYKFNLIEESSTFQKNSPYNIYRKVRPNDTRHFAFLNLMLQGYHPSEIARLGGHNSIYSQMSYHKHLEYWVDSDLINLLMSQKQYFNELSNEFYKNLIFKNAIISTINLTETVHIQLDIGFCVDPLQDCPVDEHYLCPHWRLTYEDYQKHSEELHNSIKKQESILKLCVDKLLNLHKSGLIYNENNLYNETNSEFNYQLVESSKAVKDALYQLSKLKERVETYEK